jgi:glycerol uptake operon antiterminator
MIRKICSMSRVPVICGGLIQDKEDVMHALASGAAAISTTSSDVWFM